MLSGAIGIVQWIFRTEWIVSFLIIQMPGYSARNLYVLPWNANFYLTLHALDKLSCGWSGKPCIYLQKPQKVVAKPPAKKVESSSEESDEDEDSEDEKVYIDHYIKFHVWFDLFFLFLLCSRFLNCNPPLPVLPHIEVGWFWSTPFSFRTSLIGTEFCLAICCLGLWSFR